MNSFLKLLRSIAKSFFYAIRGLCGTIKNERNFRIHLVAIFYVVIFSLIYGLSRSEKAVLIITLFIVPAFEIMNTAVENMVNIRTEDKNRYARIAKDTAAAAVLFVATMAVFVAICLFSDLDNLSRTLKIILTPPWLIIILISLVPAYLFVNWGGKSKKKDKK